jgi:hypothetical protein
MEIQSFFKITHPACFLLLNQIVNTFPAIRMRQEDAFLAGTLIERPSDDQWTVKERRPAFREKINISRT